MSEFLELIADVRLRLVWRKDQQEWLPSIGSGGAVPWSWTACEVMRLLGDYQAGVTRSVLTSELQRRWRENNHIFGRNMAGRTGSLELIHQEGNVPFEAVLEVKLGARVNAELSDKVVMHQLTDWRGGRIDWYVHHKLAHLISTGLFPRDPLLRLTGLRCMQTRSLASGRSVSRLLPTELFTVLLATLEELAFVRDGCQGCMWGRVLDAGKRTAEGRTVILDVQGEKRRLLLHEDQIALGELLKANDTLLLLDPLVGRAPGVVELSPMTVICQHSHDPLAGGQHSEDLIARVERVKLVDLLVTPARNATVLLLVTGRAEPIQQGSGVVLKVWDESVVDSVPLCCWGRHGVDSASQLEVGQWVLMQGLLSKKGKEDQRMVLHCESESWGSRVAGALPLGGLLASPGLWHSTLSLDTATTRRGGGPVAGVTVVAVKLPTADQPVTVRLDDGLCAIWAAACPVAAQQLAAASGARLSDLVGSKWHMWLSVGPPPLSVARIDSCVPVHAAQYVGSRFNNFAIK